eukprot:320769-Prymnesium_polylepis.2
MSHVPTRRWSFQTPQGVACRRDSLLAPSESSRCASKNFGGRRGQPLALPPCESRSTQSPRGRWTLDRADNRGALTSNADRLLRFAHAEHVEPVRGVDVDPRHLIAKAGLPALPPNWRPSTLALRGGARAVAPAPIEPALAATAEDPAAAQNSFRLPRTLWG